MQTKIQVYLFCTFLAKDLHNIVLFCYFEGIFKHYNTNYRENVPSLPDCSNHPAARLHRRYRHLCPLRLQGGNGAEHCCQRTRRDQYHRLCRRPHDRYASLRIIKGGVLEPRSSFKAPLGAKVEIIKGKIM